MSLSVILANYNHAKDLPRSLRAMLRQGPALSELIVVDDGSTDLSIEVIESLQRDHPVIRLIKHDQNRGAPAAFNTGLAVAGSEFVYFAAADDFVLGDFFSVATAALTQSPQAAYFCGQVVCVDRDGNVTGFRPLFQPFKSDAFISPAEARDMARRIDNWAVGPSVVYRRKFFLDIGGQDEALGSFSDGINCRLLAFRHGFYYSSYLTAAWDVRRDSFSARAALSPTEGPRLVAAAEDRLASTCPPPLNKEYPQLYARRLRFNMARFALLSPTADTSAIADLVALGDFDRNLIAFFGTKTSLSRLAILTWLILRLRPYRLTTLAGAGLRYLVKKAAQRTIATRAIAAAIK